MTARPAPSERQDRNRPREPSAPSPTSKAPAAHLVADWWAVVVLGALTTGVFARVGSSVFRHGSTPLDFFVRDWITRHQIAWLVTAFTWITTIGGTRYMYVVALLAAAFLWRRGHRRVAMRCLVVPAASMLIYETAKRIYARARPPGIGGITEGAFSFPSAHATASAAVCATLAYLFWREGFIRRSTAWIVTIVPPLLIGSSRLYLDRHWTTDVLGGWSVGFLIAAYTAALYRRGRRRRTARAANEEFTLAND
jgi:membrane-associated phospholipid phosphatase